MLKKLLIFIICIAMLTSCTAAAQRDADGAKAERGEKKAKLPKCADYGEGDVSYTAELSDGKRSVIFDAERRNGITTATVRSPEELSGTLITDDTEGMRMILAGGCELPISAEASAGLAAVFALYLPLPDDAKAAGEGEVEFSVGEYTAGLKLTEDGYPHAATLSKDGAERQIRFTARR